MSDIAIVLLAAGASRRLGAPKQLLAFRGETLVRRTARLALATPCRPVVVVLGAQEAAIAPELSDLDLTVVFNPDWAEGMSTSLRAGLRRALELSPQVAAVLLLVVDQPYLTAGQLEQLIRRYEQEHPPIVASTYEGRPGTPALIDRSLFAELDQLQGDQGARGLFRRYEQRLVGVPFPAGGFDLDTPEDVRRLREREEE